MAKSLSLLTGKLADPDLEGFQRLKIGSDHLNGLDANQAAPALAFFDPSYHVQARITSKGSYLRDRFAAKIAQRARDSEAGECGEVDASSGIERLGGFDQGQKCHRLKFIAGLGRLAFIRLARERASGR